MSGLFSNIDNIEKKNIVKEKENQNISSQLFHMSKKIDNIGNHVIDYTNNMVSNVQDISNNIVLRAGHTRPIFNRTHSYFSSTLR